MAKDARRWAWVNGDLLPDLEHDSRVIAVRYEDRVHDPETAMRDVRAHLGEAFGPAMLSPRAERGVDPAAAGMNPQWAPWLRRHEASARSEVATSSIDKWHELLTGHEIALIEAITGETMRRLGYDSFVTTPAEQRRAQALALLAETACQAELALRKAVRRVIGPAGEARSRAGPARS